MTAMSGSGELAPSTRLIRKPRIQLHGKESQHLRLVVLHPFHTDIVIVIMHGFAPKTKTGKFRQKGWHILIFPWLTNIGRRIFKRDILRISVTLRMLSSERSAPPPPTIVTCYGDQDRCRISDPGIKNIRILGSDI